MMRAPVPANDVERVADLHRYEILDTEAEVEFDDFTRLAAQICGASMALLTLVDKDRQWYKSRLGFEAGEGPRDISFCGHAILGREVFEVPDATRDERFFDFPSVAGDPYIRFYAGAPLLTRSGNAIGTLCVFDSHVKKLTGEQVRALEALGRQVIRQLELRLMLRREKETNEVLTWDIAERKKVREAVDRLNADLERRVNLRTLELEKKVEDLKLLSHSLAHDLRQPLISISGYSHRLKKEVVSREGQHFLERIANGVDQVNIRADALLYFANLSGRQLQRATIDLGPLASRQLARLQREQPQRLLSASVQPHILIRADERLITEAINELILNAWKFTLGRDQTVIEVGSEPGEQGETICFVRDNGAGFNLAYVNTVFEPFQRIEGTPGEEGQGMGLAKVKWIIDKHGGRIWVESEPGKGATFYFTVGPTQAFLDQALHQPLTDTRLP